MKKVSSYGKAHGDIGLLPIEEQNAFRDYAEHAFLFSAPAVPPASPFRWVFEICRREHPSISTDPSVLGGIPHIDQSRIAVSHVLEKLYVLRSIQAVAEYYAPYITESQAQEAVGFAELFMELAGDPYQVYD